MATFRKLTLSSILLAFAVPSCYADKRSLPDACKLKAPPASSKSITGHAFDLLVFPSALPANYTGCRRAWFADGTPFITVEFISGIPRVVRVTAPKGNSFTCHFSSDSQLLNGPPEECDPPSNWLRFPGGA